MNTACHPETSRRASDSIVHAWRGNCGAPARRQADHFSAVFAPLEMFMPGITAWIEKLDGAVCKRVLGLPSIALKRVAKRTTQAEILKLRRATCRTRKDVIKMKGRHRHLLQG
jgi:hypothetical protein